MAVTRRSPKNIVEVEWRGPELTNEIRKVIGSELWESAQNIASGAQSIAGPGVYADTIIPIKGKDQGGNLTGRPAASFVRTGTEGVKGEDPRRPGSVMEVGSARNPARKTVWPAYDREKPALQQRLTDVI